MNTDFKAGVLVRFKASKSHIAKISNHIKFPSWKIPGYLGKGFYQLTTPKGQEIIAYEDDIEVILEDSNV